MGLDQSMCTVWTEPDPDYVIVVSVGYLTFCAEFFSGHPRGIIEREADPS